MEAPANKPLAQFVYALTDQERHEIIATHEKFETQGYIGDEAVRTYTQKFIDQLKLPSNTPIVIWMSVLAHECYRYFYDTKLRDQHLDLKN